MSGAVVSAARDDDVHNSLVKVKKKHRTTADVGSSKRAKKTRYIDLHQEFKEAPIMLGKERDSQFLGGEDRHFVVKSSLADFANSILVAQQKPF